jgi:hypothetical protein
MSCWSPGINHGGKLWPKTLRLNGRHKESSTSTLDGCFQYISSIHLCMQHGSHPPHMFDAWKHKYKHWLVSTCFFLWSGRHVLMYAASITSVIRCRKSRDGQQPMKVNIPPIKEELPRLYMPWNTGISHTWRPTNKMPPQPTATQTRLKNVTTCLTITADTLEALANDLKIPLLEPICNTTQSLLKCIEVTCLNKLVNDHESHQSRRWNKTGMTVLTWWNKPKTCSMQLSLFTSSLIRVQICHQLCWSMWGDSQSIRNNLETLVFYWPILFRTLHKIHTFVEAQQKGNKIKKFFQQGEMGILLNNCNAGLQDGVDFFQVCCGASIGTTHWDITCT